MTQQLSYKISIASFLATIMVVYRHSLNYLAFFGTWTADGVNGWVQDSIMRLTEIAVPFFFLVSGFFFFRSTSYTWREYTEMLRKKWWGLGVPFLFWNVIGLFVLIVTDNSRIGNNIDFILNLLNSEWYGPLWYVRDLITMMMLAPFFLIFGNILLKVSKTLVVALLFFLIIIELYYWQPVDCVWLSSESVLFFTMGGILQRYSTLIEKTLPKWILLFLSCMWIWQSFGGYISKEYHKINTLIGIVIFWQLLNYVPSGTKNFFMRYTSYSFLVYVLHFYIIKSMKVSLGRVFYENELVSLISYLLLPLLTVVLIIQIGKIFKNVLPNVYKRSMGGR